MLMEFSLMQRILIYLIASIIFIVPIWIATLIEEGKDKHE